MWDAKTDILVIIVVASGYYSRSICAGNRPFGRWRDPQCRCAAPPREWAKRSLTLPGEPHGAQELQPLPESLLPSGPAGCWERETRSGG
jgi:hypothetical protein